MLHANTLAARTLVTMARQRLGLDEQHCAAVLELMAGGAAIGAALHEILARHALTDLQFDLLVILFALAPRPIAPADLAHYTGFARSSVSSALGELQARQCITAERAADDRRSVDVLLTDAGRQLAEAAATEYLRTLGRLSVAFEAEESGLLPRVHARLTKILSDPAAPLSESALP